MGLEPGHLRVRAESLAKAPQGSVPGNAVVWPTQWSSIRMDRGLNARLNPKLFDGALGLTLGPPPRLPGSDHRRESVCRDRCGTRWRWRSDRGRPGFGSGCPTRDRSADRSWFQCGMLGRRRWACAIVDGPPFSAAAEEESSGSEWARGPTTRADTRHSHEVPVAPAGRA